MSGVPPLASNRPETVYAWRGSSLLVVDPRGRAGPHPLSGFYFRQTRFLRDLRLELRGEPPFPCSLAESQPNELEFTYIYPSAADSGGGGAGGIGEKDGILLRDVDLRLRYRVRPASLEVTLWITNRWHTQVSLEVAWILGADYASVDEAEFGKPERRAEVQSRPIPGGLGFDYGHPRLPLQTHIIGYGAEWVVSDHGLSSTLSLPRQTTQEIGLIVRAVDFEQNLDAEGEARREQRLATWRQGTTKLYAPGDIPLVEITDRAITDVGSFALLEDPPEEWLTPGAGVPLYLTLWGRDALTSAWQAGLWDRGEMLTCVLARLGRLQGTRDDPEREEMPGRIVNQAKMDPLSRLGDSPFDRFYADFASPFMYIIGVGYHYALTADRSALERHWDKARRVLDWARQSGDRDGDGYLEYLTRSKHGPSHQGWKDSENAVVDEAGERVLPPIAPCEIQGYYYVSLQYMAALSMILGEPQTARDLWRQATDLKQRFNRDYWMEEEGFVAFGLDAQKRQIRAVTSNAGHVLATGIVSEDHVARLVRRLFQPDMFSGWGIRTLSSENPAYNPLDYHLGSVWPVENGTILFGLRRYGLTDNFLELARGLYDLARLWPGGRIPECVGGYSRMEAAHPGAYPRANRPQTWNQSALPLLMQSMLGLVPVAPLKLLLVDPILPPWLPEVTLKNLRIGDSKIGLRFVRDENGNATFEVLERQGSVKVVRQPWIESFSTGIWERLEALVDTVLHR